MSRPPDYGARFRLLQAVHNGALLLCLVCNGMTYYPAGDDLHERLYEGMDSHVLWCPGILEDVLAYFASRVKRSGGSAGWPEGQGD